MNVAVDVSIESRHWAGVADLETLAETAIAAALRESRTGVPAGAEVSCLFCDDATIRALNARWRGIDKATNVLSFPGGSAPGSAMLLGDVVLAFETVEREARADRKSVADHVTHLLIHGLLHLVGYDHERPEEADAMEALETRTMATLGRPDPYADRPVTAPP